MSDSYTKLFSSITESTIWSEPSGTRLVWITMLAMVRRDGVVYASLPGLADRAKVSLEETVIALKALSSPDPYSRTKEHEGRRIEEIDGGWLLLNHGKYSAMRSTEERREYMRNLMAEKRLAEKLANVSNVSPTSTNTSTSSSTKDQSQKTIVPKESGTKCPQSEIVALYHELLPNLIRVQHWTEARQALLRKRWAEKPERQTLDWWRTFFVYVSESDFLTGRASSRDGRPFECDLEWLVRPRNFVKVIEGKYENRGAAA